MSLHHAISGRGPSCSHVNRDVPDESLGGTMLRSRNKGYRFAVAWIALNDGAGDDMSHETLAELITVMLIADLYDKHPWQVAKDVDRCRAINAS